MDASRDRSLAASSALDGWSPIETFDPAIHQDSYLFANDCNVIMGHWYEGEPEPRMAYTGQEFPIWPTHWRPMPQPPVQQTDSSSPG